MGTDSAVYSYYCCRNSLWNDPRENIEFNEMVDPDWICMGWHSRKLAVGMAGSVIQITGNNHFVTRTRSSVGKTEINIILNIELSNL